MKQSSLFIVIVLATLCLTACDDASKATPPANDLPDKPLAKPTPKTKPVVEVTKPKTVKLTKDEAQKRMQEAYAKMTERERALYITCMKEKGAPCLDLGKLYIKRARTQKADKVKSDDSWRKAMLAFKRGCKGNDMASCVALGDVYEQGEAIEKNDTVASFLYKQACDRKYDAGCLKLGKMQKAGRAGKIKASTEVIKAENASCDKGMGKACARLGSRYEDGVNVKKNPVTARIYFERACKLNYQLSCHAVAVKLMKSKEDDKRALKLFEGACDADLLQSCYNAAYLLQFNRGAKRDIKRMSGLLQKACDKKYQPACAQLAQLKKATVSKDTPKK